MAIKDFFSRKASNFTRYSKNVTNYDYVVEETKNIKNTMVKVFGTQHYLKNAKVETFKEAQIRLGITEMEVMEVYRGLCVSFYTYAAISITLFFLLIYILFFLKVLLTALMVLTVLGISLANCFKYSFRAFQFKHRKLCPVSDWYDSGEFLPDFPDSQMILSAKAQDEIDNNEHDKVLTEDEKIAIQEEIKRELEESNKKLSEKIKQEEEEYNMRRKKEKEDAMLLLKSLNEKYLNKDKGDNE